MKNKTLKQIEQENINKECEIAYKSCMNELNKNSKYCGQLRSCSASVYETENYYILQSYQTFIACIEKSTDVLYDFLRIVYGYTSTSAQHISKFSHDYCNGSNKWGCSERLTAR